MIKMYDLSRIIWRQVVHTSKTKSYNIPIVYEYCEGKLKEIIYTKNEIDSEICYLQADDFRRTFCIMGSWEKYLANLSL